MTARPLGFIVIDKDGVRFERMPQPSLLPLALGVLIGLALAMRLKRPSSAGPASGAFAALCRSAGRAAKAECAFPAPRRVLNRNNVLCHGWAYDDARRGTPGRREET